MLDGDRAEAIESEEPANIIPLRAPEAPTEQEIEEHEAGGHPNFSSWCRACVAGQSRDQPHRAQDRSEIAVPTFHADYGSLGKMTKLKRRMRDACLYL